MHADTRQRLLNIAEQLFAERGFYGVSIAAIASEVGFTKQGLLHYFNSKEKLYGAILQRISDDFQDHQREALEASEDPAERLEKFYAALADGYQLLGAVNYFLISISTLKAMYGAKFIEAISADFIKSLNRLINGGLNSGT